MSASRLRQAAGSEEATEAHPPSSTQHSPRSLVTTTQQPTTATPDVDEARALYAQSFTDINELAAHHAGISSPGAAARGTAANPAAALRPTLPRAERPQAIWHVGSVGVTPHTTHGFCELASNTSVQKGGA
jgi:hypothetical protein